MLSYLEKTAYQYFFNSCYEYCAFLSGGQTSVAVAYLQKQKVAWMAKPCDFEMNTFDSFSLKVRKFTRDAVVRGMIGHGSLSEKRRHSTERSREGTVRKQRPLGAVARTQFPDIEPIYISKRRCTIDEYNYNRNTAPCRTIPLTREWKTTWSKVTNFRQITGFPIIMFSRISSAG